MKITTFQSRAGERRVGLHGAYGLLDVAVATKILVEAHDSAVRDAAGSLARIDTVRQLLDLGDAGLAALRVIERAASSPELARAIQEPGSFQLLPPVPDLDKFLCVGKNSRSHLEELKRNDLIKEMPREPTGFIKLGCILSGDNAAVERPADITSLDYEPEIVFVIGRPSFQVSPAQALQHCAGITLLNDLSAREIQKQEVASGTRFWTSKNMPGFGPVGPYIVTLDEFEDPTNLTVSCQVNGQERLRYNTREQIFGIAEALAHFSKRVPFYPGDMISLGSPGGVAVGKPNAQELYLKPGDVVDVTLDGVMTLRTSIVAPAGASAKNRG